MVKKLHLHAYLYERGWEKLAGNLWFRGFFLIEQLVFSMQSCTTTISILTEV